MNNEEITKRIDLIEKEIKHLKDLIMKNNFSNLYVFDTPVMFRRTTDMSQIPITVATTIFPVNNTAIATSTTDSTGKIAIEIGGAIKYVPYY
jgi:hypothetical protein